MSALVRMRWLWTHSSTPLRQRIACSPCSNSIIRTKSSSGAVRNLLKAKAMPKGDHGEYILIYKLTPIRWIAALSRMKLLQTGILMGLCATSGYYVYSAQSELQSFYIVCSMAALAITVLFLISHFSRRLIGLAWLDKSQKTVKVAHLTFWGQRNDRIYQLSSMGEMTDTVQDNRNPFLKLKIRDSPEFYYFTLYGCYVPRKDLFSKVFGNACLRLYSARNRKPK